MFDRIETLQEKKLLGHSLKMCLEKNRTEELWSGFMPLKKQLKNTVGHSLISMQVFGPNLNFKDFKPQTVFTKWAAVEVTDFKLVPESLSSYTLSGGLYAVFIHIGLPSEFHKTIQYIFGRWMPDSNYELDSREHFELLAETYRPDDPEAREEVWIPIKKRNDHL